MTSIPYADLDLRRMKGRMLGRAIAIGILAVRQGRGLRTGTTLVAEPLDGSG